ncbi:MAG: ribonuclease [Paenibacillaceae bacterium]|nr:ribonuclease [Paenibacillaceae bacterium]
MIREIIVVEGKDDTSAIKQATGADTIETGGSAIGEDVLKAIELAYERRGVIVFTDPDHAGERIRKIVAARVPGCKHAFLREADARRGMGVGVEHASPDKIREALSAVMTEHPGEPGQIAWDDLARAGLVLHPQAAERRRAVGQRLGFGYANGKQFHKRCTMFQISRAEFERALDETGLLSKQGGRDE